MRPRPGHHFSLVAATLVVAVAGLPAASAVVTARVAAEQVRGATVRVSVHGSGAQAASGSGWTAPAISRTGRYVAFVSASGDLTPGDTNNSADIFARDRRQRTTTLISTSTTGGPADDNSNQPAMTPDGRYVVFDSFASNLVPGDTNDSQDVFVRDSRRGKTLLVSVDDTGEQGDSDSASAAITPDGRYVAFTSNAVNLSRAADTNEAPDVFVRDLRKGVTRRVSVSNAEEGGNRSSLSPAISGNGRYVAFSSKATNLVRGDTNEALDVFVRDRWAGTTRRVSVSSSQAQGNDVSASASITPDGRYVGFDSAASNLVRGDTNGSADGFLRDRRTGTTRRVTLSSTGAQGNEGSSRPDFSADGRYLAFFSFATNLVRRDTNEEADVFLRDRRTGDTRRVSVSNSGRQGNGESSLMAISGNGRHVAFVSEAADLVARDTNGALDAFVRDLPRPGQ
jgi:predicted RNA-binding protein with TRAM domain